MIHLNIQTDKFSNLKVSKRMELKFDAYKSIY